jgi:hypothetical protein
VSTEAAGTEPWATPPVPPLFAHLLDDTALLAPRSTGPAIEAVAARYLAARSGRHGGLVGRLVCPVSRLPALVSELARSLPSPPVDLALVVDTGLGGVPKALSTVASRASLVVPRTVETSAPPDVDAMWLERVSEFVPEDVVAVVEPRRPHAEDAAGSGAWLAAVRRVAEHGCSPKLRCGGPRASDVPSSEDVEMFLRVAVEAGRPFTIHGLSEVVSDGSGRHGVLNVLLAAVRTQAGEDSAAVRAVLGTTDGPALAAEVGALSEQAVKEVRGLVARCGSDALPVESLAALGLLA